MRDDFHDRWRLVVLFLTALSLRLTHLWTIRDSLPFRYLLLDPSYYDRWAREIAAGEWLGSTVFFQDPGYAYFLATIYALFGESHLLAISIQTVLGSLVPVLVYLAARSWIGRPAALVSAVIAVAYLPSIFYEGLILKTWLAVLLVAVTMWLLSCAIRSRRLAPWLAAGVVLGLGSVTRGNLLLVAPALALWALLDPEVGARRPGCGRTRAACLVLGVSLILAVTATRNRVVTGAWIPSTANAGQNFFIGNNAANPEGEYVTLPFVEANPEREQRDFAAEAERRAGRSLGPDEVSAFWMRQGWRWIREHPGDWLALSYSKLRLLLGAFELPDNVDYYLYREISPVLRLPLAGFGLVAPFAILGMVALARRPGWPRALLVFAGAYAVSVLLFFVRSRLRMALMPAAFVFAGFALVDLSRMLALAWRQRRVTLALPWRVAVLVLAVLFVNLPVRGPHRLWTVRAAERLGLPVRVQTTAQSHFNLGVELAEHATDDAGLFDEAERELRRAISLAGADARNLTELGKVLARADRLDEALETYDSAVRLDPDYWPAQFGLAVVRSRTGRWPEAWVSVRRAAALAPRNEMVQVFLGETLLRFGRYTEAERAFRAALAAAPDAAPALRGLGIVEQRSAQRQSARERWRRGLELERADRIEEALEAFEQAIALGPYNEEWRYHFGSLFVVHGSLAEVEAYYREAVAADPKPQTSYYFWGTALARAGRLEEALERLERALAVDPAHEASWVTRGDVLLARGDRSGAIESYREALRVLPGLAEAHRRLAVVLALEGRSEEAQRHRQEAQAGQGVDPRRHFHWGRALLHHGRVDAAILELEIAVETDPADREARELLTEARGRR